MLLWSEATCRTSSHLWGHSAWTRHLLLCSVWLRQRFPTWDLLKHFNRGMCGKTQKGGGTRTWLNRGLDGESGGSHWHTYSSHAQMHSGTTASVAIHPREKQTHTPSDSDEEGVGETPDWADEAGRGTSHSLATGSVCYSLQRLWGFVLVRNWERAIATAAIILSKWSSG